MLVGSSVDDSLKTSVEILVPTLPANTIGKLLSSAHRYVRAKQAKDLVYVTELMARDQLATLIIEGIPQVIANHPDEGRKARQWLSAAINDRHLIEEAASQVVESSGLGSMTTVRYAPRSLLGCDGSRKKAGPEAARCARWVGPGRTGTTDWHQPVRGANAKAPPALTRPAALRVPPYGPG